MKREPSGCCGISLLAFSLAAIIGGIAALFDLRTEGDGGNGALGLLVFIAILSPLIYWGYAMLHKFLLPGEPVRLTKKIAQIGMAQKTE